MKSNYKTLGDYIKPVNNRNKEMVSTDLRGLSMTKEFRKSTSNIIGTDLSKYKLVYKNQFACDFMSVIRVHKLPVVLHEEEMPVIVSPAYTIFEIKDETQLNPEYLMMWFRRPEFDRYADFRCDSAIRGGFKWDELCEVELPIPSIEKQREIVAEYNTVVNRIKLNEQLNRKLEETAQAVYKNWFSETNNKNQPLEDLIEFNPKHSIKKGEIVSYVEMSDLQEEKMSIKNIAQRGFTAGSKFKNGDTLLARITPCLENGKTAFVDGLNEDEIAYGSTEFIVLRPKPNVSKFWVYCLAREDDFRSHAISSMIGSSGRQRVNSDYLKEYKVPLVSEEDMCDFHSAVKPIFEIIRLKSDENQSLIKMKDLILSKMTQLEPEKEREIQWN